MTAGLAAATRDAILAAAARLRPDLTALLRAAVRTPSVNPARSGAAGAAGEGRVQDLVAAELARLGAGLDVWEPDGAALAERYPVLRAMSTADYHGRPNVVGVLGDAGDLRLILNSHADTVAADAARWRRDPFGGEVEDGWLYGLGAADAKGSLVAYLGALRVLREAGVRLAGGVALTSVVDEEAGGGGTLACIERGYRAPGALVGEPTSFAVCPGSRGAFGLAVTVAGRSAHLGVAYQGVNAIEQALPYLRAFQELGRDLDRAYRHPLWTPLPAGHVLSVTGITADTAAGTVPARCTFRCSVGYTAGEREGDILARVEQVFAAVTAADPWLREHPPEVETTMPAFEPAAADAGHPLVGALLAAAGDLGLAAPPVEALSAATDGRWLTNVGATPAINFGPGDMRRGHSPDEAIRLDDFYRAVAWVALAVARYCGVA